MKVLFGFLAFSFFFNAPFMESRPIDTSTPSFVLGDDGRFPKPKFKKKKKPNRPGGHFHFGTPLCDACKRKPGREG